MSELKVKTCSKCKETKSITAFSSKACRCRDCVREYNSKYYENNKEKIQVTGKVWRGSHQAVIKANRDRYYAENTAKVLAANAAYREKNYEKVVAKGLEWKKANLSKVRGYYKAFYAHNRDAVLAKNAEWIKQNPERHKELVKHWYLANPELRRVYKRNRRSREAGLEGYHTFEDIRLLFELQEGLCVYCGERLDDYHVDHIIPVSREGSTNWVSNLQLLCPHCNLSKNDKTHEEFVEYRARIGLEAA